MVAETLTASRAASDQPVFKASGAGDLCCAYGQITLAANVEDGDIFEMCRIPAGAVVVGGSIYADDLDTNATETLDMDIGWADNGSDVADPDGFGNLGVWTGDVTADHKPVVGNMFPLQGVLFTGGPKTFVNETIIQIEANAAAATGGTGSLSVVVYYVNP
jgi:hypothetical protein